MNKETNKSICSGINLSNGTDVQCLSGYAGPLCYACAKDYVYKDNKCTYCPKTTDMTAVLGVYFCMCLILFSVVFVLIRKTTTHKREGDEGYSGPGAVDFYVDLTTIMISFLQVLSAVITQRILLSIGLKVFKRQVNPLVLLI